MAKKKVMGEGNKHSKIDVLIETSIDLQKSLTDAVIAMNKVVHQQEELVNIFTDAAKHINDVEVKDENLRPLVKRLDELLQQNRVVARGLLMLEKYVKERSSPQMRQQMPPAPGPM
ncbi:MAG: hypothetical protein HYS32_00375 [Candidatus Woesearchaeota archaeon]|nr:MAG: hypothetical protein HYS32_00375 [Candidatus Woesearchaeota archaeon]